jgi:F0F1-type ATP synthase membrane subunit b/b'
VNSSLKGLLLLIFLLVYGSLINMMNQAVVTNKRAAGNARTSMEVSVETAFKDLPPLVQRYEADAWRWKRSIHLINMSLMFLLFYVGLWPLVRRTLDQGIVGVSEKIRDAERRFEVAGNELEEAQAHLAKIDVDVAAILEREREVAEREAERLHTFAVQEADQIQEHASLTIRREEKRGQAKLLAKVADQAVTQALEGLAEDIDEATCARLHESLVGGFQA